MNTDTGRIYDPETYQRLLGTTNMTEDELAESMKGQLIDRIELQDFRKAYAAGKIVPISDDVARLVKTGQRVEDRRRKRKAAKAARKANRA